MSLKTLAATLALVAIYAAIPCHPPVFAQNDEAVKKTVNSLDDAMTDLASEIHRFVATESETGGAVRLGTFTGPDSSGAAIVQKLRTELSGKVRMLQIGGYCVNGKYEMGQQESRFVTVITAIINNPAGNEVHRFSKRVYSVTDPSAAFSLNGLTVDATKQPSSAQGAQAAKKPEQTPETSEAELSKRVEQAVSNPQAFVKDNVARFSESSPYGMEIVLKNPDGSYRTCPIDPETLKQGLCKVDLDPKQIYAVRIHNATDRFVGVALSIDGINIFAFSEVPAWKKLGKMVARPGEVTIKGWNVNPVKSHEFVITNYGESVAGQLGQVEGVGTITAVFYEITSTRDIATGKGQEVEMIYRGVPADFGLELGAISIRYVRPAPPEDLPTGN